MQIRADNCGDILGKWSKGSACELLPNRLIREIIRFPTASAMSAELDWVRSRDPDRSKRLLKKFRIVFLIFQQKTSHASWVVSRESWVVSCELWASWASVRLSDRLSPSHSTNVLRVQYGLPGKISHHETRKVPRAPCRVLTVYHQHKTMHASLVLFPIISRENRFYQA